ncbi:hypothetical protein AVEN_8169-1, partial [Araneus ventricosus]
TTSQKRAFFLRSQEHHSLQED